MIAFVKESESLIEKGQLDRLRGEEGETKGPPCPLHDKGDRQGPRSYPRVSTPPLATAGGELQGSLS